MEKAFILSLSLKKQIIIQSWFPVLIPKLLKYSVIIIDVMYIFNKICAHASSIESPSLSWLITKFTFQPIHLGIHPDNNSSELDFDSTEIYRQAIF